MSSAYVCLITRENMQVIASEHPKFDRNEFEAWLTAHNGGYFLRDKSSPFDCTYIDEGVFLELYGFECSDRGELFRPVVKR